MTSLPKPFSAYKGIEPYVFVSYAHRDDGEVYPELEWLHNEGINIWYDEGIEPGYEWRAEIARAIKKSQLLLFFASPNSVISENCKREVNLADQVGVPVLTIFLSPTQLPDGLDLTLSGQQAILKYEIPVNSYRTKLMVGVGLSAPTERVEEEPVAAINSIAVLPFVNMSSDEEQEYFADGLTEEILNALARIEGLVVTARTSSFAYKKQQKDLREVARELGVNYVLEGSVRRSGQRIRITAQLIEARSGTHLFSDAFTRELDLTDVFSIQDDITGQVASALKISLLHDNDQYTSSGQLDYVTVEKLIVARAKLATWEELPIRQAVASLVEMNEKFPDNPLIMGLLVYGYGMLSSSSASTIEREEEIALAKATLVLDPSNLDALDSLAVLYNDKAVTRSDAGRLYKDIIRYYPGKPVGYSLMISYLFEVATPCDEIRHFIDSAPDGILHKEKLFALNHKLNSRLDSSERKQLPDNMTATQRQRLDFVDLNYGKKTARSFEVMSEMAEKNPIQRHLIVLYQFYRVMGAKHACAELFKRIDVSHKGHLASFAALEALFGSESGTLSEKVIEWLLSDSPKAPYPEFATALIIDAQRTGHEEHLEAYLADVPDFPVDIMNHEECIGLTMLQWATGYEAKSQKTAIRLLAEIDRYHSSQSSSYHFYGLGWSHLVSSLYAGELGKIDAIIENGFAENEDYWLLDYEITKVATLPWSDDPKITEFLKCIDQSRSQARAKYQLR